MRQQLPDHWTLELDIAYSRRETDDGYTIFAQPGMEIWAVVYCEQPFDPEAAVRSYLDWPQSAESEFAFRSNSDGIAGRAVLTREGGGWTLVAVAAALGRIVRLDFRFQERFEVDAAVNIWHGLRHTPPAWVTMCGHADPPLARLREALERGIYIEPAITDARDRHQIAEAKAVLLQSLKSESATVRQSACEAFGYLGESSEEVMSALRNTLGDDIIQVRAWAADALMDLGEPRSSVVPSMIEGLKRREEPMPKGEDRIQGVCGYLCVPDRYHAARILSSVGEAARPAREALLAHQMDESGDVRLRVAEALVSLGEPTAMILPPLLHGLRDPDMSDRERMRFVKPLMEFGVSPEIILPVIVHTLDNASDQSAKFEALEVLHIVAPAPGDDLTEP